MIGQKLGLEGSMENLTDPRNCDLLQAPEPRSAGLLLSLSEQSRKMF